MKNYIKFLWLCSVIVFPTVILSSLMAQSKLYNSSGALNADPSYKIGKKELIRWAGLEDSLIKNVLTRVAYPQMMLDNSISSSMIISFTIDGKGFLNDFRIENYKSHLKKNELPNDIKLLSAACFNALIHLSGKYISPQITSKISNRYYLPFRFIANGKENSKGILDHWIVISNKYPDLIPKEMMIDDGGLLKNHE
ncbi:MAG: hypothetical protein V4616_06195 [Bacteroidota bacterium]